MKKISNIISLFMKLSLVVLIIGMINSNIKILKIDILNNNYVLDSFNICYMFVYIFIIIIDIIVLFNNMGYKKKIFIILLLGTLLRVIWLLNINTVILSDYLTMYTQANNILVGDYNGLKGFEYFARFPHLIPTVLYMSLLIKIFPVLNIIVYRFINLLLSVFCMFLIYKIGKKLINNDKGQLICLIIASVFPSFIAYISTYCTENLAIWLYLIGILIFVNKIDCYKNENKFFNIKESLFCAIIGFVLGIANLFRAVGMIFIIAIIMYILIFKEKRKFFNVVFLVIGYAFITFLVSFVLIQFKLIDNPLYVSAEPKITSVLKGSNFESNGRWNEKDAIFIQENLLEENFEDECKELILQRVKNLSVYDILKLLENKYIIMWGNGSNGGVYWATLGTEYNLACIDSLFNIIYIILLILSIIGLLKKNEKINLFYILVGGFILLFLLIEVQSRYSYIVSFLFIFFSAFGIEQILDFIKKRKQLFFPMK